MIITSEKPNVISGEDWEQQLTRIPPGQYRCRKWYELTKRGGWLTVERKDGETSIMWTSGKNTHQPLCGPATIVDLDAHGKLTAYYESVITLHLKWGHRQGTETQRQRGLSEARWMASVLCNKANVRFS